VALVKSHNSDS